LSHTHREADLIDVFVHATPTGHDVVVRAAWDRRCVEPAGDLWATVAAHPVRGSGAVAVPRHDDAPSRPAVVTLRSARVTLRPPAHRRAEHLAAPTVTAVWGREASPPDSTPPLDGLLLTTLPVDDLTAAETVVRYSTYRWRVERDHYVLQSGCHVEGLHLEPVDRLDRAVAGYRIVAGWLLGLTYWVQHQPDQPYTTVLRPAEWAARYAAHTRRRVFGHAGKTRVGKTLNFFGDVIGRPHERATSVPDRKAPRNVASISLVND
jgi:hypothetical protein